jgi:hypothetical protein
MDKAYRKDASISPTRRVPFVLLVQSVVLVLCAGFAAWIFQPHVETFLRDHVDLGWSAVIMDFYPASLLDEETFGESWLLCESLLRVSITFLFALTCYAALRQRSNLLSQYVPMRVRNRLHILTLGCPFRVRLSILATLLILTPLVVICATLRANLRRIEERAKAAAEENRLYPKPLPLSVAELEKLGGTITNAGMSRFVFAYELTGTNTICPIHLAPLRRQSVPVLRGMVTYPGWRLLEGFPYGRLSVPGGCTGYPGGNQLAVLRCTNCVALNERYCELSEHHMREIWKAQQNEFVTVGSPNFVRDCWNDFLSKLNTIF